MAIIDSLPFRVSDAIKQGVLDENKIVLEDYQVYLKMKGLKKPHSSVDGDIPRKLLIECLPEFVKPITKIFNMITKKCQYPIDWKKESQISIPKIKSPETEDDVRNLSKTKFTSKLYERFLCDWLLPIVEPYLDPGQYGGMKGSSVSHYMVKLLNFIHTNVDKKDPHAVVLCLLDLSKAYNRGSPSLVLVDLFDMHTPGWILSLVASYMSNRTMSLQYNGVSSEVKNMPGSFSQGCFLMMILFIIQFNGALMRPQVPRCICDSSKKQCDQKRILFFSHKKKNKLNSAQDLSVKFIDDCSA